MRGHLDSASRNGFGVCPTLTPYQAYVIANRLDPLAKDVAAADIKGCSPAIPWEVALHQAQSAAESAWVPLKFQSTDVLEALIAVARRLASAQGTRVLLMVSPGFVTGGMEKQAGAFIDTCLRAHIVVNGLDDEGLLGDGAESPESLGAHTGPRVGWAAETMMLRGQIVTELLADAAASTGGQFIHNNNDLAGALRSLAAPPEVSYLIGFSPTEKPDGKYHKLKLTTNKAGGYQVSARPGYLAAVQTPK
jgi:VWFA-related protein